MDPVTVCNQALDNIGARFSITSLEPPLPAPNAVTVARHYQPKMDALFRAAHWNCARVQSPNLTVLKAARGTPENPSGSGPVPPVPWQYEYGMPADCLKARYLIPNPPTSGGDNPFPAGVAITPSGMWFEGAWFAVGISRDTSNNQIKVIWTNLQYAQLVYTARILDPDLWDPQFLLAGTATLGAWLVNPINRNAEILKEQIGIASEIIKAARVSDGNEGTASTDDMPDWMLVRGVTGLGAGWNGAYAFYGWDSMGFPGGLIV